jgi:hypothetical protein
MSNGEEATDWAVHLVDLIINQDQVAQGWVKFLISIEAALAVGLGFVLKIGGEKPGFLEQRFAPWAMGLIPFFGVVAAIILCMIIVRERKCQAAYVQKFRQFQGVEPPGRLAELFPTNEDINTQGLGFISSRIMAFTTLIALGWVIVFIALVSG